MTISAPAAPPAIRPATGADAPWLARTIAAAFHDDPVWAWMFPGPDASRLARYERFCRLAALPAMLPAGASTTVDGAAGAAIWLPPGKAHPTAWEQLRMAPVVVRLAGRRTPRLLSCLAAMEARHPRDEHWYLPLFAVAPTMQRRGLGSRLLGPVLDRCDATGTPAYLEATSPVNRRLYERCGFATREVLHLPGGGPPVWLMWRDPVRLP